MKVILEICKKKTKMGTIVWLVAVVAGRNLYIQRGHSHFHKHRKSSLYRIENKSACR